jgi:hypothetical protein
MVFRVGLSLCLWTLSMTMGLPQTATTPVNQRLALFQQHQGDFDYLLGDWGFTGVRKRANAPDQKLHGYMSAACFPKGPTILLQDRLLNDDGSTFFESSTLIVYNAGLDQWELASIGDDGPGVGLQDRGVAHKDAGEMHIEQRFGSMSPKPTIWRIRHYDIAPDHYSLSADRSTDDGRTWQANYERIELRRIGPARSLGPLITEKTAIMRTPRP